MLVYQRVICGWLMLVNDGINDGIIPTDELRFFRGIETTNQMVLSGIHRWI